MYSDKEIIQITKYFEQLFSHHDYNGIKISKTPFDIKLGSKPILISAPHSVNQYRSGVVKKADLYTGSIVNLMHVLTDCMCIYSSRFSDEDPNFINDGEYKKGIRNLVAKHEIKYILDIHGAAINRDFDIDLGTVYGKSINIGIINEIVNIFNKNGIKNIKTNHNFPASHTGTVTNYALNVLAVPSVQLEINKKYRDPENQEQYLKLISSLKSIIYFLEGM